MEQERNIAINQFQVVTPVDVLAVNSFAMYVLASQPDYPHNKPIEQPVINRWAHTALGRQRHFIEQQHPDVSEAVAFEALAIAGSALAQRIAEITEQKATLEHMRKTLPWVQNSDIGRVSVQFAVTPPVVERLVPDARTKLADVFIFDETEG